MNYQQTVSETRLVSLITTQILKDFPNNIPRNLRAPAFRTLSRIAQAFTDLTKDKPDTAETKISIGDKNKKKARANQKITTDETAEKFALEILDVMISCVGREEKKFSFKDLNFQRLQSFQGLVMHFSNFEGILADSLRAICCVRPEVMKNKKTVEWEEILSLKSWKELMDVLTEKFVRDLGWQSLEERVETFRTRFGLEINLAENDRAVLKEIELIRNLIVHNAGKINAAYLKLKPTENLKCGDLIPINDNYLEDVSRTLRLIASDIYLEISIRYFGKEENEANTCIWTKRE